MKKESKYPDNDFSDNLKVDEGFFKVPDGYFEQLPDLILNRTSQRPALRPVFGGNIIYRVAAVIAFLAIGLVVYRNFLTHKEPVQVADFTIEEFSNSSYALELDEYIISSHVSINTVSDSGQTGEIVEYLMNQQIDPNQISQEL